jgi:hypothetical protein
MYPPHPMSPSIEALHLFPGCPWPLMYKWGQAGASSSPPSDSTNLRLGPSVALPKSHAEGLLLAYRALEYFPQNMSMHPSCYFLTSEMPSGRALTFPPCKISFASGHRATTWRWDGPARRQNELEEGNVWSPDCKEHDLFKTVFCKRPYKDHLP